MRWFSSFFAGLPVSWYVIAVLFTSLSLSLWFLQGKIEEIGGLKTAQASYVEALKSSQKQLEMRDLSCKIDDASVVEVEAEKKDLQTKIEVVSDNIEKLRIPVAVKQENIKNENLKPNVLPDDGLLSDAVRKLLHEGYCSTYPTDDSCISK